MTLNINDAYALAAILRAAETGAAVHRTDGLATTTGLAGAILTSDGRLPGRGDDIRSCCLSVATADGREMWLISDLMAELQQDLVEFASLEAPT